MGGACVLLFLKWEGGGGVGIQQSFIQRGSAPWSTLTTLYTILDRKGTLFLYLPLTNGTPFKYLAAVVQTLDSAIHRISRYPADKY